MDKKTTAQQKRKELIAVIIGIGLVALVATITIGRQFIGNPDNLKKNDSAINVPTISAQELKEKIFQKEKIHIIDIREKNFYDLSHIPSSDNIPLDALSSAALNFPLNESIALVGYETSSLENNNAVEILQNKGYQNVSVIIGGINTWTLNNGATISSGDPNSFIDQSKVVFINAEEIKNLIENKSQSIFIIDVRSEQEFKKEHLPLAHNIFLNDIESAKKDVPFSKKIIVYGGNELQGFQAGVRLYDLGFFNTQVLKLGITDWKGKGFSLEK
jgi:rhodanese-related sulfurtransferase